MNETMNMRINFYLLALMRIMLASACDCEGCCWQCGQRRGAGNDDQIHEFFCERNYYQLLIANTLSYLNVVTGCSCAQTFAFCWLRQWYMESNLPLLFAWFWKLSIYDVWLLNVLVQVLTLDCIFIQHPAHVLILN